MGSLRHLQSSEGGHASYRKTGGPNRYLGNSTKRSIIGEDLNLPYAVWNGNAECTSGSQAFVNTTRLVWENWYTQFVDRPTRGDALLVVYLVRPESSFTSCSMVQGLSDHCEVL
jgi:hypothetical protein